MSDNFVKNPMDAVKVGDTFEFRIISLDIERRRISLSRKSRAANLQPGKTQKPAPQDKKKIAVSTTTEKSSYKKDDDGTMYNPFAEAFRKKR